MKALPWHSRLPLAPFVHHDETECEVGNNIEPENVVKGTGNRPKCKRCREISG
jgi:hypothetical protein